MFVSTYRLVYKRSIDFSCCLFSSASTSYHPSAVYKSRSVHRFHLPFFQSQHRNVLYQVSLFPHTVTKMTVSTFCVHLDTSKPTILRVYTGSPNEDPEEYKQHLRDCLDEVNKPELKDFWSGDIPPETPPREFNGELMHCIAFLCFPSVGHSSNAYAFWIRQCELLWADAQTPSDEN